MLPLNKKQITKIGRTKDFPIQFQNFYSAKMKRQKVADLNFAQND